MNDKIKYVSVEYIESGTFCGGEEDVFNAEIERGEHCIVLSKTNYKQLAIAACKYKLLLELLDDPSGDLDFIKHRAAIMEGNK